MDIFLVVIACICIFKKRYEIAFVIMIAFFTAYFRIGPDTSMGHNLSDTGLILFALLYIKGLFNKYQFKYKILYKIRIPVITFSIFLLVSFIYDLFNGSNLKWILKTSRHWIVPILSLQLLTFYKIDVFEKVLKYLCYITIIASIIILSDYFLDTHFAYENSMSIENIQYLPYKRSANPTTFVLFYIFLLITDYYKNWNLSPLKKNISLFILILSTVVSINRSTIIALLIGICLVLFLTGKIRFKNSLKILLMSTTLVLILFSVPGIGTRMTEGLSEIISISQDTSNTEVNGTMSFRFALFMERAEFICKDILTFIFGIGNIPTELFPQIFNIGLVDENDNVYQLISADIAWAPLVLRLGFVGMFIFITILIRIVYQTSLYKNNISFSTLAYCSLTFFFLSFASSSITNGFNFFFILMLLILSEYQQKNKYNSNLLLK